MLAKLIGKCFTVQRQKKAMGSGHISKNDQNPVLFRNKHFNYKLSSHCDNKKANKTTEDLVLSAAINMAQLLCKSSVNQLKIRRIQDMFEDIKQ